MTERRFKLPHEYTPQEAEERTDQIVRLMLREHLKEMEETLRHASPQYPNRARLLKLVEEFKTLQS